MTGTVLVTGGSGYIAGETIRQLLGKGWRVHTTIRNLDRAPAVRAELGGDEEHLKFFAADLTSDAGWAEAMAGCTHLCHMASPFPTSVPRDENELIVPAREGALRALRFAGAAGVRHVVMTSSVAAVAYGHPDRSPPRGAYDERDWTDVNAPNIQPYIKSKTIAERAARDWVAASGEGMAFCTVNPAAVVGPIVGHDFAASIELVKRLLDGSMPALPNAGFCIVDVRDIADLHVRALEAPAETIRDERFIGSSGPFLTFADTAAILRDRLGPAARKVPTRRMPDWAVRLLAMVMPPARQLLGELGRSRATSSAHAQTKLGWAPRPPEESLVDCANSLIAQGVVKV